ncbi:hypothetical protein RJ640_021495 [Escallonia rubra]|uniref:Uncharacterized protein n=1 Tax=Escallonia rubra TaxID=112253 RepID=A0AA88U7I7_9ASTE|nr:hypothetical protein RJ640_021495 [Escallonia rubra]
MLHFTPSQAHVGTSTATSMAIAAAGLVRFGSAAAATGAADESDHRVKDNVGRDSEVSVKRGECDSFFTLLAPKWKRLSSNDLGISNSMIDRPTRVVLNGLKRNENRISYYLVINGQMINNRSLVVLPLSLLKMTNSTIWNIHCHDVYSFLIVFPPPATPFFEGFEAYLVGGCVRDLILKRTPKDFDVITSAELKEVMSTFSRCEKIGKRFPICHVHVDDDIVEVSSFSTSVAKSDGGSTLLMFDPFSNSVYDYIGGMEDIRKAKVLKSRILRAVRIAARLGFGFARETAHTIKILASSILRLDKGRLLMEMNYMLAYGSAEASLRLLWRFGLLEILLPIQAAYLVRLGFKRRDKRSNMLLCLFSKMDKLLAPDRPCHSSLWVAILAFHKALSDKPRDPLVVAAFSLAVHNGGDICEALKIARMISKPHDISFHELMESQNLGSKALKDEVMHLAESVRSALCDMTDEYYVSQAMAWYPKAPYSDLVFIPLVLYLRVCKIFECVKVGKEDGFVSKQGSKVDQDMLTLGSLQEVRHVFARVVFDSVYPMNLGQTL